MPYLRHFFLVFSYISTNISPLRGLYCSLFTPHTHSHTRSFLSPLTIHNSPLTSPLSFTQTLLGLTDTTRFSSAPTNTSPLRGLKLFTFYRSLFTPHTRSFLSPLTSHSHTHFSPLRRFYDSHHLQLLRFVFKGNTSNFNAEYWI